MKDKANTKTATGVQTVSGMEKHRGGGTVRTELTASDNAKAQSYIPMSKRNVRSYSNTYRAKGMDKTITTDAKQMANMVKEV